MYAMACRNRVHKNNSLFGHGDAEHTCRVRFSARAINADVAKWQTRLAQTQLEQSIPVQVRSSVSVDLAQLVQHWSRKPAGEMVRREGSTPVPTNLPVGRPAGFCFSWRIKVIPPRLPRP